MGLLQGKVALVTGSAKGMGRAICELFAQQGANVVVAARKLAEAEAVAAALPGDTLPVALDIANREQWEAAIKAVDAKYGRLDVLVNNAGLSEGETTEAVSEENWHRHFAINCDGPFFGIRAALPLMRKSGGEGSIVNIGSAFSVRVVPGFAAYGASKAAMTVMSRILALELAPQRPLIRVNVVHPGGTKTGMFDDACERTGMTHDEAEQMYLGIHPIGRLGLPEDVAQAALWLASDLSRNTTGAEIPVDGASAIRP
jgi:3alpha(or 20beta)-hydroxysteroid dehydrogenase